MTDIKPTIGRKIWYFPDADDVIVCRKSIDPCDATIVFVHPDGLINVSVYDHRGYQHRREGVPVLQGPDPKPLPRSFCAWMPFQLGQAARTEAAEKKLSGSEFVGQPLAIDPKLHGGET